MVGARTVGVSRATLRSAALMRRCQPGPRARKWAMTSRSRRSEMSSLVGAFCRPRERRYASTISGTTSFAGRIRAHISSVRGGLSGSLSAPARISASSSSVIVASWRNALRRASAHSLFTFLDISSCVRPFRFAQADNPYQVRSTGEYENVKSLPNPPDCALAQFAVVLSIVHLNYSRVPFEVFGRREVDFVLSAVQLPLRLVPTVRRLSFHNYYYRNELCRWQANCSYNVLFGTVQ
jgi:hypothetical protein